MANYWMELLCFVCIWWTIIQLLISAVIDIIVFPKSDEAKKTMLGEYYQTRQCVESTTRILFNLGTYNILCCFFLIRNICNGKTSVVMAVMRVLMLCAMTKVGLSFMRNFENIKSVLMFAVPPTTAVVLHHLAHASTTPNTLKNVPMAVMLVFVVMLVFFLMEFVLFSQFELVQLIIIGTHADSRDAVRFSSRTLTHQGFLHLYLGCAVVYGMLEGDTDAVLAILSIILSAAVIRGPLGMMIQGGTAAYAFYYVAYSTASTASTT